MPSARSALAAIAAILALAALAVALAPPAPGASAQTNGAILRQVQGVLTDANGNHVGWQWITAVSSVVHLEGSDVRSASGWSAARGEFTLALPDGAYRLSVWTDWGDACAMTGYEPAGGAPNAITVAGRAVGGITLVLSGARLAEPRWIECDITEGPAVTELRPGLNLAGWTEAGADVAALFEAIPRLDRAYAWDADKRRYRRAARDGSGDLRTLTPGMGLWLTLGGAEPFTWTRPALASGGLVQLREGRNLVAWAGRDGIPASEAFAGLGDALVAVWHWDETAQRVVRAERPSNTLRTLAKGGAYWVDVSAPREWWQFAPRVGFLGSFTPARQVELRAAVRSVVEFFARHIGIRVPGLTVQFDAATRDGPCAFYTAKVVYLRCIPALAHEYNHAIQEYHATIEEDGRWSHVWTRYGDSQISPLWMTEGVANYWSHRYHDETSEQTYDGRIRADTTAVRRIATRLRDLERDLSIGGDEPANYSLGTLAVDWLVNHMGEAAVTDFYRQRPSHPDWQSAFLAVFGMTADDFYGMFEEHRAREFPPYALVMGSVRGPGGEPLENVRVRGGRWGPDGEDWHAVTGPDGAFGRPVRPGSYRVSFTNAPDDDCHFGWYDGDADLVSRGGEATPVVVGDVDVMGIDIQLSAAPAELASALCARVEGVVLGPDGAPLPGIETTLARQDSLYEGTWTDQHGAFSIVAPNGSYELRLYDDSCWLGVYGGDGARWNERGRPPTITVADVADVSGIVIRLTDTPEALTRGRC